MKNRLILPIVLCALLCTCFAAAYGDSSESNDLLIPEEFVSNYNEAIAFLLPARYGDQLDEEFLANLIKYLSLSLTEEMNNAVYYDNQDWAIEFAGMYNNGEIDPLSPSDALTFSIDNNLGESTVYEIQLAFLLTICLRESGLLMEDLLEAVTEAVIPDDGTYYKVDLGRNTLALFINNGRTYYGIAPDKTDE